MRFPVFCIDIVIQFDQFGPVIPFAFAYIKVTVKSVKPVYEHLLSVMGKAGAVCVPVNHKERGQVDRLGPFSILFLCKKNSIVKLKFPGKGHG
jgi:hypothetical protein